MGSGDNSTTDISERLHIAIAKDSYGSSNRVSYIGHMLKHKDRCTGLENMEETLSHLALHGWNDID